MAIRTTSSAVLLLMDGVDPLTDLTSFIEVASHIVDRISDADEDDEVSSATLELIERWLSAHAYAQRDPSVVPTSERAGPVGASYQSSVGLFLKNTRYGQMAILLDPTGTLLELSEGRGKLVASVHWLGTPHDGDLVTED